MGRRVLRPDRLAVRPADGRARGGVLAARHGARRHRLHGRRRRADLVLPAGPHLPPRRVRAAGGRRPGPAGHAAGRPDQRLLRRAAARSRGVRQPRPLASHADGPRAARRGAAPPSSAGRWTRWRCGHDPPRAPARERRDARALRPALLRDRAGAARPHRRAQGRRSAAVRRDAVRRVRREPDDRPQRRPAAHAGRVSSTACRGAARSSPSRPSIARPAACCRSRRRCAAVAGCRPHACCPATSASRGPPRRRGSSSSRAPT